MEKNKVALTPYRGTRDLFPEQMQKLNHIFSVWGDVAERFGYQEYLGPLLEPWELYAGKNVSGQEIVDEQLYWFEDKSGRKVAIRPEMTPTVARMLAQQIKRLPKPVRWYSIANFMRYERPQQGRLREFFQLNLDAFGEKNDQIDAEIIEVGITIMQEFGADENMFEIRVNNRLFINDWLRKKAGVEGKMQRLSKVIDRASKQPKNEVIKALRELELDQGQIDQVMQLSKITLREVEQFQSESSGAQELVGLFKILAERGLDMFVKFDASLMRGFDYYTGNVFEQFDLNPENRRSMFGGGRYDELIGMLGNVEVPAVGFAPGDVTTLEFLENWGLLPEFDSKIQVLVTVFEPDLRKHSWQIARDLRLSGVNTELYTKEDSISTQLNYADRKKIPNVVILGPGEIDAQSAVLKNMQTGEQKILSFPDLIKEISSNLQ